MIRQLASRLPTYVTLKDVKKRWGQGQEDVFPQWRDSRSSGATSRPFPNSALNSSWSHGCEDSNFKDPAQLDGWSRDGSRDYLESLGVWS